MINEVLKNLNLIAERDRLNCPLCENRDCIDNAEGRCFNISTIMDSVPDGVYGCNSPKYTSLVPLEGLGVTKITPF